MASTSGGAKRSPSTLKEPVINNVQYPSPLARYEEVVANPKVFLATLEKFHASVGTKFMIPIIGGKELDLHRLFVEVTSRGGIDKIISERKWKEVTATFNFPSTATNASFVLRKYYTSLLYHYEQLYFFKARGPSQNLLLPQAPAQIPVQFSPEYQAATAPKQRTSATELSGAMPGHYPVTGVIDGKFDSGYLVTVMIGTEKLKGVLYQASHSQHDMNTAKSFAEVNTVSGTKRRRRRKKHEIKRRDPNHPKPNRSGYNFFFAEQHARLKPLHPGKDREISRMIGELWNKLNETEKAVYQEKALKDKERYKTEMEDYRTRVRSGRVISDAVPLQQWVPNSDAENASQVNTKSEEVQGEDSPGTMDEDMSSSESDYKDAATTVGDQKPAPKEASPVDGLSDAAQEASVAAKGEDNV